MNAQTENSSSTPLVSIAPLIKVLDQFSADRDWEQFHSPKNLVMALTGEVGELAEIFQWMTEAQSREAHTDPKIAQAIDDELADVFLYLARLASVLNVDMDAAIKQKLLKNAEKYPAQMVWGSSKKYTELLKK
ncbi:nucleotide pyrophosphohydrolase [Advenella kashmirensis W13003]|uniref:Nucleotide pyrophosphohydrolase n=1 Tax=Advenella kashmirensis W13003 TaxID=1424334 RepID=V8QWC3_9BURK|nr:nucleotide pyrophosphohydrolase [Advenella kashmirensis]ETF03952.1 nucleotide pyrophosphohydrolase [Advenella kashmirensis W13003]